MTHDLPPSPEPLFWHAHLREAKSALGAARRVQFALAPWTRRSWEKALAARWLTRLEESVIEAMEALLPMLDDPQSFLPGGPRGGAEGFIDELTRSAGQSAAMRLMIDSLAHVLDLRGPPSLEEFDRLREAGLLDPAGAEMATLRFARQAVEGYGRLPPFEVDGSMWGAVADMLNCALGSSLPWPPPSVARGWMEEATPPARQGGAKPKSLSL